MRSSRAPGDTSNWSEADLGRDSRLQLYHLVYNERWTGASVALHALMLLCMALLPPKSSALALDMLNEDVRYARYLTTAVERDPAPWLETGKQQDAESGGAAKGTEGAAGEPLVAAKPRRMGGGKPVPAHDARAEARAAGILGVLPAADSRVGAPGLFTETGVNYDARAALGAIFGDEIGAASGFGGLGLRGTGRSGGGDVSGSIGVGQIGKGLAGNCTGCGVGGMRSVGSLEHEARVPRIRQEGAEVRGSLSKEAIRRTIQRHLNEVRFCYENALRTQPELAGRVQVAFVITTAGEVQQANVVESGLHNSGVERCIAEAVKRWTFPAPDGGGYVTVRYPFVFEQIGQ